MISRASIIQCARTYIGTPFHHCGRRKRVAIDCGGLVAGVYSELVGPCDALSNYSQYPDGVTLKAEVERFLEPTCPKCLGPGDVVGYWYERRGVLQHLGILSNVGLIHAYAQARKCVESAVSAKLQKRFMYVWRFPGVEPVDDFEPADLQDLTDPLRYYEGCCN